MKSKSNQTIAYDFKTRDIKVLKKLLPYLIKMRARVIWAVSFLMLAKLANVAVPLFNELRDAIFAKVRYQCNQIHCMVTYLSKNGIT